MNLQLGQGSVGTAHLGSMWMKVENPVSKWLTHMAGWWCGLMTRSVAEATGPGPQLLSLWTFA